MIYALAGIGLIFLIALLAALAWMVYSDLFGKTKSKYRMLTPIDFKERTSMIAEDQEEYITLPAFVDEETEYGHIVCCWRFSYLERLKVLVTGKLWSKTVTFRHTLQPVTFSVNKSDVLNYNN